MRHSSERPVAITRMIFDALQAVLALRLAFVFFGASGTDGFSQLFFGMTDALVRPFRLMLPPTIMNGFMVEWATVISMIVTAVLGALFVQLVHAMMSPTEDHIDETVYRSVRHHRNHPRSA